MSEKKNPLPSPSRPASMFGLLGIASTMGMHMVSGPVVGGGLGWLIDRGLGSWPVGFGIGIVLGIVAGFRNVWIDAKRLERGQAELDAARAAEQAARTQSALTGEGRRTAGVPKRQLLPEEHQEEPDSDVSNRKGTFDEPGENRGRSGPPPDSSLAADDADKAWEAYAELEHELKEENATHVGSPVPNDADPNRKHGETPERTS